MFYVIKENKEGNIVWLQDLLLWRKNLRKEAEVVGKWSVKTGWGYTFFVHNHDWQNLQKTCKNLLTLLSESDILIQSSNELC